MRFVLLALFALCLTAAGAVSPASAQDPKMTMGEGPTLLLKQYAPSHPEHMAIAFYKVAGLAPDYMAWAKESPFLRSAKNMDRDAIVSREDNRLRRAFAEFDMDAPLVVHTNINLDDYSTLQEMLEISEFTPKTFFSYSIYGENIAIIPKGITNFSKLQITADKMNEMLAKSGGNKVKAELLLKPAVADAKEPFVYNHINYWLLLSEIAEIRFWSPKEERPELLWSWRADWYQPKEDNRLLDLKSGGIQ